MAYNEGFRKKRFGPREMHKIKCSECGKDAEVPFKPVGDRPVYCRDCFLKKKGITPREPEEKAEEAEAEEEVEEKAEEAEAEAEEEAEEEKPTEKPKKASKKKKK